MGHASDMDQSPCLDDIDKNHLPIVESESEKEAVTNEVSIPSQDDYVNSEKPHLSSYDAEDNQFMRRSTRLRKEPAYLKDYYKK